MDNNGLHAITLGSLFDGIGGFPLCAVLSGVTPLWAAEIDPACVAITKYHFPDMIHYGDVSQINGADIPPVDIITFGSPCQDLSIAGKQKGMKHERKGDNETTRSGLFVEAIRIVYEMRRATNGLYPTFIVWENVPGAFSSRNGRDFQAVLEEITKTDIPMPRSGRWANAGVVRGIGINIAWRVFDAQYWGIPQRRKRIYLVGSFGSDCAEKILFERDSVQRYLAPRRKERETASSHDRAGLESRDFVFDCRGGGSGTIAPTMTGDHNSRVSDYSAIVCSPISVRERCGCEGGGKGCLIQENKTGPITTHNDQFAIYSAFFGTPKSSGGDYSGGSGNIVVNLLNWIVRRLTPLECERLQGYPDGWTILPKIKEMTADEYELFSTAFILDKTIRGKVIKRPPSKEQLICWYNKLDTDGTRYRQLGNSLAIPCALRVIRYITNHIKQEVQKHENTQNN